MNVKVTMNNQALQKVTAEVKRAVEKTAEALLTDIIQEQYIPMDTGNLQNISTQIDRANINIGQISIYHMTPYAARVYFDPSINFQKTHNANARGEWWEPYIKGKKKKLATDFFAYILQREIGM